MRRVAIAAIPVLALLLVPGGASAAHARRVLPAKCAPGSRILFADSQAVVYTVRERIVIPFVGGGHEVQMVIATRGCVYGHRGSYKLGEEYVPTPTEGGGGIKNLVLGGSVVAYEESSSTATRYTREGEAVSSTWRVIVRNLKNGRVLHNAPTGITSPPNPHFVGDGPTTMILVKGDGAVAWITDTVQSENRYQVHALDKTGARTLAVGSNIDPNSLALAGSTLYWMQGGKPESTPLD